MARNRSFGAVACAVLGIALLAASALMACGDQPEAEGGRLKVTQVFKPAEPIAMEGSAAALTVKQGGESVAHVRTGISQVHELEVLLDRRLSAGMYEVQVAHQACYGPGSCWMPGENSFLRCAGEVEVRDGETSEAIVRVSSGFLAHKPSTCSIAKT